MLPRRSITLPIFLDDLALLHVPSCHLATRHLNLGWTTPKYRLSATAGEVLCSPGLYTRYQIRFGSRDIRYTRIYIIHCLINLANWHCRITKFLCNRHQQDWRSLENHNPREDLLESVDLVITSQSQEKAWSC